MPFSLQKLVLEQDYADDEDVELIVGAEDEEEAEEEPEEEEILAKGSYTSSDAESDRQFDVLIGILETMLLDDEFVSIVNNFGSKYCMEFEQDSVNKLIYTERFVQYNEMIEHFMEKYVIERMKEEGISTTMHQIEDMVSNRLDEITGDVLDVLLSFSDFEEFKQMMLSHKDQATNGNLRSLR